MIGGTDVLIPTTAGSSALDACVRVIRRQWPQAVFEDAATGVLFDDYAELSFRDLPELFVYQNRQVARVWEEEGAVPSLQNTMIHVLVSATDLTLVVDHPSSAPMTCMLESITRAVRMDILNLAVQPEPLLLSPSPRPRWRPPS